MPMPSECELGLPWTRRSSLVRLDVRLKGRDAMNSALSLSSSRAIQRAADHSLRVCQASGISP